MHSRLVPLSLLAILALVLLGGPLQGKDDVKDPNTYIERLAQARGERFWDTVGSLEEMGGSAIAACEKALERHEAFVRIGCAKVLYTNERKRDGMTALLAVLKDEQDKEARIAAADLVGSLLRNDRDYEGAKEVVGQVEDVLDQCTENALRIPLAKALYHASGDQSLRALESLKELLKSDDPALQMDAALALADVDSFDAARDVLYKLAEEPTDRGRLAALYIRHKQLIDRLERQQFPSADPKYAMLDEIVDLVVKQYVDEDKADTKKLVEAAAKGMTDSLDPFSGYLNGKERKRLRESIEMKYGGIGAHVSMRDEWLTIERPVYGGPADKAELRSDDRVVEVGGQSTKGKDLEDLVGMLKGEPGTPVTFKVMRRGWTKEKEFTINRERIKIDTAMGEMLPGNIGYVVMTSFGDTTADELLICLDNLQKAGAKALIVDVRNNPGGYLAAAVRIVDHFIEKGKVVVETKGRGGKLLERLLTEDDDKIDLPVDILINGGSASASEIFSGAMHDHKRATLVGEKSYGKGSVQHIIDLKSSTDESALRLTIAKYYLPSGICIHRSPDGKTGGIDPDLKQEPPKRDFWKEAEFATLLEAATLDQYIKDRWSVSKDAFYKLAEDDGRDTANYPEFDTLFGTLTTHLTKDDVRELLRSRVRRFVQDDRKREFLTDVQGDDQLQRAVLDLCTKAQIDPETVPQFKPFIHKFDKQDQATGK